MDSTFQNLLILYSPERLIGEICKEVYERGWAS